jgi:hypothetical protein
VLRDFGGVQSRCVLRGFWARVRWRLGIIAVRSVQPESACVVLRGDNSLVGAHRLGNSSALPGMASRAGNDICLVLLCDRIFLQVTAPKVTTAVTLRRASITELCQES